MYFRDTLRTYKIITATQSGFDTQRDRIYARVGPMARLNRDNNLPKMFVVFNEPNICPQKTTLKLLNIYYAF